MSFQKAESKLGLSKEALETAFVRMVEEGLLEKKMWGGHSRFVVNKSFISPAAGSTRVPAQVMKQALAAAGGGGGDGGDDDDGRMPMTTGDTAEGSDSDDETVGEEPGPFAGAGHKLQSVQQHAPPKARRPAPASPPSSRRRGASRLASEYLLEQGNGFDVSLTQESVRDTNKCSVVQKPIVQGNFKRARK